MLRQFICFICFLVPFASTGATQQGSMSCGLKPSTAPETDETSDNDLNSYNELLGEVLDVFLESKGIPVRLVFDCNLAKDAQKVGKLEKSFMVVAENKINADGKLQLTSLADHFEVIMQKVQEEVEKLQKPKKPSCFDCFKCCGTKPMTFRFGCRYNVHRSIISTKCTFEKLKSK